MALLIRVLHFWAISDIALFRVHTVVESDSRAYWNWAQQILTGHLLDAYHAYTQSEQLTAPLDTWYRWWGGKEIFRTALVGAPLFSLSNQAAVSFIATHAADSTPSPAGDVWGGSTRKRILERSDGTLFPTIRDTLRLGLLYLGLEEPGRARAFFMRFLELEPDGARADQIRRLLLQLGGSS
ncbi:MAG: hypothetical protein HY713_10685 [candidate division NC10 bacterium]|nr:hypothetical protein [candidate division NC10 bacterium]